MRQKAFLEFQITANQAQIRPPKTYDAGVDVIKSFRFGLKAKVKGALESVSQEIEDISEMSSEQKSEHFLERFGKIIGILITVGTILVIGKAVLGR